VTFTQVQNGVSITASTTGGVTTLALPLPAASTAGTLLVATMVAGQSGKPFKISAVTSTTGSNPNTSPGWEWCCTSVNGSGGGGQQVEVWCWRNNPGNINSTTWTFTGSDGARGHIAEYSTTSAWQVMELFPGINTAVTSGDTSFPVSMGNPVGSGELAIALFGDNFSTGTTNTWTTPGGWTLNRSSSGNSIAMHWASYYKTTTGTGAVSVTGTASTNTNQIGWEAAVVVFREVAAVRSRVGASCSDASYNDQASFGLPSTRIGSAKEFDVFVGRPMAMQAAVAYQKEANGHLTAGPPGDMQNLFNAGIQVCWTMRPRRTGFTGFTTVADEQAAVDQDLTLVKQSGINGFICTMYNEHNMGGMNGYFGNDTFKPSGDPYGNVGTGAAGAKQARKNWLTYWANYQPTYAAHGIPIYTKPSYASPVSVSSWHPPAGTCSGVMADYYASDSIGKTAYLDQSAGTELADGTTAPALTAICDGTRNPDNSVATNTPVPLGIGEIGRSGGGNLPPQAPTWPAFVSWSHTGGGTGHMRDVFAARITAGKQNAPILWFENNLGAGNWIHIPGVNGEDQTGICAELAAWVDNLGPTAGSGTPAVTVTTTSLPNGALGVAYSQALQVSGGTAPYTWATLTGTLPTGLSLTPSTGVISGTPTVAGTYTFTVTATDAGSNVGTSGSLQIFVPSMAITTTALNPVAFGGAYSQTLTESGGTGPFTWAVVAGQGDLPDGITLSSGGVLSGTDAGQAGQYPVTIRLTDSLGNTAFANLSILVTGSGPGGGTPAPATAGFPQLIVEAGFYAASPVAPDGTFILDDPTAGLLDTAHLADTIAWTDITTYVRSGTVTRASTRVQGPLRVYQAGTGSMVLDNTTGRFDPDNPNGAYVTGGVSGIRPMIPLRVRAVYGPNEYKVFSGFADSWQETPVDYDAGWSEVTVSGSDGFKILAGITLPATAALGAREPTGTRIGRILSNAGWYTDHRRIDGGNSVVQATTYGDTALNLMQLTADSEIGELYIDGAGNVVFRERLAAVSDTRSTTPQAVFGDLPGTVDPEGTELACAAIGRAHDDTEMANDIQVTRAGGTLQEEQNAASIRKYMFPRSYARSDIILTTDADADGYAQWVLYVSLATEDRFDSITIDPVADPANLFPQVLGREIGDRIMVYRRPQNSGTVIGKPCFVRGITHTVDVTAGTWSTTWDLQNATRYSNFLVLDDTTLGKLSAGNKMAY